MGLCKICASPHCAEIDKALAGGEPQRAVERRFGLIQGALTWHVQRKHVAESVEDLDDEPYIIDGRGSYDWIIRQSRARGLAVQKILGTTRRNDPFFYGSDKDIAKAVWFRDAVVRRFEKQTKSTKPHLRRLHYLCVTAPQKPDDPLSVKWPDGRLYENTFKDWTRLQAWSKIARWLGDVDIEDFDDQRNAEPKQNADEESAVSSSPFVSSVGWADWEMPNIDVSLLDVGKWIIPNIVAVGYSPDDFLDTPGIVGVFIEKSTQNDWLDKLCEELHVDLYVGSGTQSITNAARFIKRAADTGKSAHLLVISDFDPAGRTMPIAASRHLDYRRRMPDAECDQWITVDQIALTPEQVAKYDLPHAPIKKTDPGMRRFQKLYGHGAVELDALEALRPGTLAEIVEDAVRAYDDDEIGQKLSDAQDWADAAIDDAWQEGDGPLLWDRLSAARAKLDAIVKPISKEMKKLARRLKDEIKKSGIESELEEIRAEGRDAVAEVVEQVTKVLPERPEPVEYTGLPEGAEHLFDSHRGYFENIESFHKFYPSDPTKKPKHKRK
jgi:hypothetical protein